MNLKEQKNKVIELIERGNKIKQTASKLPNGTPVLDVNAALFSTWMGEINIFNERYLKNHPLYKSIFTTYFQRIPRVSCCDSMIGHLQALISDNDYFGEQDENIELLNATSEFYQILIVTKKKKKITEVDITDINYIYNSIVIPYLKGEEFYVNGFILLKENISRLKIGVTKQSAKEIAAYENASIPPNVILIVSSQDIVEYDNYTKDVTAEIISKAKRIIADNIRKIEENKKLDFTKVFIVHGRDNELKQEVARFLTQLHIKPIILHEQPSQGMTIIEKIENYSNVGFGIVLYTPCDVGYEKDNEQNKCGRARQNVVFEHGYLIGKLGRKRVCALVKNEVEKPNDISGVVYVSYDANGGWKIDIAKEMQQAGYTIDLNLL